MRDSLRPLLFVVGSETSYRLHLPFARYCVAQGRRVAFVYDRPADALFARMTEELAALNGAAYALDDMVDAAAKPAFPLPLKPRFVAQAWLRLQLSKREETKDHPFRRALGSQLAAAQRLLQKVGPAIVIVAEDGVSGPAAIQAAAIGRGLQVVDLPYGYGTQRDLEISLERKSGEEGALIRCEGPAGDLVRRHAPWWIKRGLFEGTLMFPPEYILWREALGMGLRDPWIVHGGTAVVLLAESRQMFDLYVKEGIPESALVLTGTPYCDLMLDGLAEHPEARAALRSPRRIDAGRTRILVSWPPSYHSERGAKSEFSTYREMTHKLLGWLKGLPNCDVTISLHPAAPDDDKASLAEIGLKSDDEYVLRLIPRHDVYVSYYSSTIRWAIAAGKPVVNYDAYKLELDVYDAAPGVQTVSDFAGFQRAISGLVSSPEGFASIAARQVAVAQDWGILDGKCMPRILEELDRRSRS